MEKVFLLALAGAFGSLSRYGLSSIINCQHFPMGIFFVNVLGCFLFGAVWAAAGQYHFFSDETRLILLTGFMGAFTTFSTLMFDTFALGEQGRWAAMAFNLAGQIIFGLLALWCGIRLIHMLLR